MLDKMVGTFVVNTSAALHGPLVRFWSREEKRHQGKCARIPTAFQRIVSEAAAKSQCNGDELMQKIRECFFHGLGIKWGEDQVRVFNAFVFSCLPLIYGEEWAENKARVLEDWGETRECPYTVVSMARRNGKTFVTSGTVVAMMLTIPGIKVAIFSTCKRTSQMMMQACVDMIEKAFELGTHANRQEFTQVMKNTESIIYEGPDGSKRVLGCFPGSVRVSIFFSFFSFVKDTHTHPFFLKSLDGASNPHRVLATMRGAMHVFTLCGVSLVVFLIGIKIGWVVSATKRIKLPPALIEKLPPSSGSEAKPPSRVVVIVIAGGDGVLYDFYRLIWTEMGQKVRPYGIYVYMVTYSGDVMSPQGSFNAETLMIAFPGRNSLIPGCLETTLLAWQKILGEKMPGHDAAIWMRTNLSTFWKLLRIFDYIQRPDMQVVDDILYAGLAYTHNLDYFVPGGYIFMNRYTVQYVLQNVSKLDLSIVDDVSLGRFFLRAGLLLTYNLEVCIIETPAKAERVRGRLECKEDFIFRVKTGSIENDIQTWVKLYQEYYI